MFVRRLLLLGAAAAILPSCAAQSLQEEPAPQEMPKNRSTTFKLCWNAQEQINDAIEISNKELVPAYRRIDANKALLRDGTTRLQILRGLSKSNRILNEAIGTPLKHAAARLWDRLSLRPDCDEILSDSRMFAASAEKAQLHAYKLSLFLRGLSLEQGDWFDRDAATIFSATGELGDAIRALNDAALDPVLPGVNKAQTLQKVRAEVNRVNTAQGMLWHTLNDLEKKLTRVLE